MLLIIGPFLGLYILVLGIAKKQAQVGSDMQCSYLNFCCTVSANDSNKYPKGN